VTMFSSALRWVSVVWYTWYFESWLYSDTPQAMDNVKLNVDNRCRVSSRNVACL